MSEAEVKAPAVQRAPSITDEGKRIRNAWEEAQELRRPFEPGWQMVADYFYPSANFTVSSSTPVFRRNRRVVTNTPRQALKQAAALFVAYAIDTTQPFLAPNVNRGMALSGRARWGKGPDGRELALSDASRDYLDDLRWQLFDAQMAPQSGMVTAVARCGLEFLALGNCVRWVGRKRGFGPRHQHRPLRSCWWAVNEDGEIDTLFFAWTLPVWRLKTAYPEALAHPKIAKLAEDPKKARETVRLLHLVEPRQGGIRGAVSSQKPFASLTLLPDHDMFEVKAEGYDSFPYQVARMDLWEGSPYATGLGFDALPDAMALNHFSGGLERAIDLINDPVLFAPTRLFGNRLDRRPGQVNVYDPVNLGFQSLRDAIQKADIAGDPSWAERRCAALTANVEKVFFGTFINLRDASNVTAEEIRERRDLRQRAMSYLVPSFDRDLFGKGADRELEALLEEDLVPAPPAELSGVDVDWDYAGPLAKAQMLTQVDGALRLFDAAAMAKQFDESAGDVVAVHEALRTINDSLGNAPGMVNSRAAVAEMQAQRAEAEAQARENEAMTAQATALRDVGQGLASIENAGQPAMAA
ncbi:portal protein [Brevundimonas naejangsanensis]|uniref:portal protein n=1 Tax=Brevundimonas naejangsanensis TaxID=588932 RepID=UPI0026EF0531|nr:portal protein [Brevundimonas naejangsanensis]